MLTFEWSVPYIAHHKITGRMVALEKAVDETGTEKEVSKSKDF